MSRRRKSRRKRTNRLKILILTLWGLLMFIYTSDLFSTDIRRLEKGRSNWIVLKDDGTYATDGWKWMDTDTNGEERCFYLTKTGRMLKNTLTPDGFRVNENGEWVLDGVIQKRKWNDIDSYDVTWSNERYESLNEEVIYGNTKPWVFLSEPSNLETYQRINLFDEDKLKNIVDNVESLYNDMKDAGIEFVLMIGPEKESVYDEYMPAEVTKADNITRTEQLIKRLNARIPDLEIYYPRDELKSYKSKYADMGPIYYETDTHWNRIAASEATETLATISAEKKGLSYTRKNLEFKIDGLHDGDLFYYYGAGVSGAQDLYRVNAYTNTSLIPAKPIEEIILKENDDYVYTHYKSEREDALPLKFYFVGDSFRWSMRESIADTFRESYVVNRFYFDADDVLEKKPDVFVFEIVERSTPELANLPGFNTVPLPLPTLEERK